ncbi:hypothetical protein JX266_000441 [Neoarthrinium moseri]|nr:hypothetical protein JX266_000441 [Neoarthrinium moseri]
MPSLPISPSHLKFLGTLVPAVAVPLIYVLHLKRRFNLLTTTCAVVGSPDTVVLANAGGAGRNVARGVGDSETRDREILPAEVRDAPQHWIVARESVVSRHVPATDLNPQFLCPEGNGDGDGERGKAFHGMVEAYISRSMRLFNHTPQAWFMRRAITDHEARETFDAEYLDQCRFEVGDRVCGVYVVSSRTRHAGGETVILSLSPPGGWTGPVVQGNLVVGYEREDREAVGYGIRITNETVLWRRKSEKPVFLEAALGRWLHAFMVQWMVVKGVEELTNGNGVKSKVS